MAKKKKRKIWLWILLLVLAAALVSGYFYIRNQVKNLAQPNYELYQVKPGTVTRTITSSGLLESADTLSVKAESGIEVEEVYFERGDAVKEGEVLLRYDVESVSDRIDALYSELSSLDSQIMRRRTRDTITSPTSGRVKEIYVQPGDDLETVMKEKGALMLLSSDEKMQLKLQTEEKLTIGKTMTVTYEGGKQTGTVANVIEGGYLITLPDNNVPIGAEATVSDRDKTYGSATLEVHAPIYVYGTDGTVEAVSVSVNQSVRMGGKLLVLADKPADPAYADAVKSREEKADEIQRLYEMQKNPVLTAPESGIVAEVFAAKGSTLTAAVSGEDPAAFTLHTGGAVKMRVAVDELDIGIVSLGQPAVITLDAFSGESFDAEVTHISLLGTASGSITTYAVELTLSGDERLLEGMNGSAVIVAQKHENVLLLPVDAIHEDETGVYVYVKLGEEAERREIKTGLSDGSVAEILSGLKEGDVVQYLSSSYVSIVDRYNQMRNGGFGGN
ncbi:MAG: hypothetical protein IKF49_01505 [Clostridia bacterium]|nr:hypothetical protein [Clostridia bacterium]